MTVKNHAAQVIIAFLFTVLALATTGTADAKLCESGGAGFHEFNCPFINPGSDEGEDDEDASENDATDGMERGGPMLPPFMMDDAEGEEQDEDETPRRR